MAGWLQSQCSDPGSNLGMVDSIKEVRLSQSATHLFYLFKSIILSSGNLDIDLIGFCCSSSSPPKGDVPAIFMMPFATLFEFRRSMLKLKIFSDQLHLKELHS